MCLRQLEVRLAQCPFEVDGKPPEDLRGCLKRQGLFLGQHPPLREIGQGAEHSDAALTLGAVVAF